MFGIYPRWVYIFRTNVRLQTRYICSIHKPLVKSAFPRHFTSIQLKATTSIHTSTNPTKSSILQLFTTPKIAILTPKIPSNPYKIRLKSNSTQNHTQSTKFYLTNYQKSNLKITQNTSKTNTFQPYQIRKQHHYIEVIFLISSNSY